MMNQTLRQLSCCCFLDKKCCYNTIAGQTPCYVDYWKHRFDTSTSSCQIRSPNAMNVITRKWQFPFLLLLKHTFLKYFIIRIIPYTQIKLYVNYVFRNLEINFCYLLFIIFFPTSLLGLHRLVHDPLLTSNLWSFLLSRWI